MYKTFNGIHVFHSNLGQSAPTTGPRIIYVGILRICLRRSSISMTKQLTENNDDYFMRKRIKDYKGTSFSVTKASLIWKL